MPFFVFPFPLNKSSKYSQLLLSTCFQMSAVDFFSVIFLYQLSTFAKDFYFTTPNQLFVLLQYKTNAKKCSYEMKTQMSIFDFKFFFICMYYTNAFYICFIFCSYTKFFFVLFLYRFSKNLNN